MLYELISAYAIQNQLCMKNKFDYVLSLFYSSYNLDSSKYEVNYGLDGKSKIQISVGRTEFFKEKKKYDISNVIWKDLEGISLPFLFDTDMENEVVSVVEDRVIINYDIIASSFFFLSNWQEWATNKKNNEINRFPYDASIQFELNIIEKPVVNYYLSILKYAIEKAYNITLIPKEEFTTFVSHDIDACLSAWLQGSYRALLDKKPLSVFKLLYLKLFKEDAWFNFKEILAIERNLNIRSTFFFMSSKGKKGNFRNSDYTVSRKKFKKVFQDIESNKSEVGLHGSFGTCNDESLYKNDLKKLEYKVIGNRFHFLEFDVEKTIPILEKSDIRFDSTMGFAEHPGFRNGICYPFYLYDIEKDAPSTVLEIPLILMDGTLQNKKYVNISRDKAVEYVLPLIQEVRKFNGVFSILWHNTHFSEYKFKGWKEVFIEICNLCISNGSQFKNGSDILKTYEYRN